MEGQRHYGWEVGHLGALCNGDDTVNWVEANFSNLTRPGLLTSVTARGDGGQVIYDEE
jgi:hypothetical protein